MATISAHLACSHCRGDLWGCDLRGLCAGCHRPVSETIQVDAIDETTLTIHTDIACAGCGYNLRTIPIASACPECGKEVCHSLLTGELHLANVKWLLNVRDGIVALFISLLGVMVLWSVILLGHLVGGRVENAVILGMGTMAFMGSLLGVFKVCAREPRPAKGSFRVGLVARVCLVAWLVGLLANPYSLLPPWLPHRERLLMAVANIALGACLIGTSLCLKQLADRAHRQQLTHRTLIVIRTILAGSLLPTVAWLLSLLPLRRLIVLADVGMELARLGCGLTAIVLGLPLLHAYHGLITSVVPPHRP